MNIEVDKNDLLLGSGEMRDLILTHPNCQIVKCKICLDDHKQLEKLLNFLTNDNTVDHLGKYYLWLSKHDIKPTTEWGWATPKAFLRENIEQYVKDFREGKCKK